MALHDAVYEDRACTRQRDQTGDEDGVRDPE